MYCLIKPCTEDLKASKIITSLFSDIYGIVWEYIYTGNTNRYIEINTKFITVVMSAKEGGTVLGEGYRVGLNYI